MTEAGDQISPFSVPEGYKSGYVAIIGKPNAGKSTLMNALLGTKLSIVTPKVQTTRHRITGIHSDDTGQIIFLDTPGILESRYKLHDRMMDAVRRSLDDADLVLMIVDPGDPLTAEDLEVLKKGINKPVVLVLNKMDMFDEARLSRTAEKVTEIIPAEKVLRISALNSTGVDQVIPTVFERLPEGPPFYPPDQLSEMPERFFAAELIREQLFMLYRSEIPYSCTVNIVEFKQLEDIDHIDAEIVVSRSSQKGIVIGKGGKALKQLGTLARENIEAFTGRKVFLKLFVKVREKWRENDTFLRSYGYR